MDFIHFYVAFEIFQKRDVEEIFPVLCPLVGTG
jgi:hypothetical protein